MVLETYLAYNTIPVPTPTGDPNPCVALNGRIGMMADAGKLANQVEDMKVWRAQANGPLLSRIRFDLTGKPVAPHTFWDKGWSPYFVMRIPTEDWLASTQAWRDAGWTVVFSPLLDPTWRNDILQTGTQGTCPCPYVSLDRTAKIVGIHSFVLNLSDKGCRKWIVKAAEALRVRLGREGIGVDGWEAALKSKFWRNPQSNRSTPDNPVNGGAITDTPFAMGEFESGYQQTLKMLNEAGFKMLVSDFARPGDLPGDWLDDDVAEMLLGNWRPLTPP